MDEIIKANQARRAQQQNQINGSFGIDINKGRALPIGTIKKRPNGNFIKTANGWKYHSSANKSTSNEQSSDKLTKEQFREKLTHLQNTRNDFYNRGLEVSADKVQRDIDKLKPEYERLYGSKKSTTPKVKKMTLREVLADKEGRSVIDSIEERISDLRDNPGRKEHMEDVRSDAKTLKQKFGYDYDISSQEKAFKDATSKKAKITVKSSNMPLGVNSRGYAEKYNTKLVTDKFEKVLSQANLGGDWSISLHHGGLGAVSGTGMSYRLSRGKDNIKLDITTKIQSSGTKEIVRFNMNDGKTIDLSSYDSDRNGVDESGKANLATIKKITGGGIYGEENATKLLKYFLSKK